MIKFLIFVQFVFGGDEMIRFPVIGDWGGSSYIIFPTGHTIAQEPGAQT